MFIKRTLEEKILALAHQFPAIGLLGPRQSGKTTLAKNTFTEHRYFNLEDISIRSLIREDPHAFLSKYKDGPGIIFDEIQNLPELFSFIQVYIDEYKRKGFFILTGSQNFALNQAISQSLAGRIALLTLLPLSIKELRQGNLLPDSIDETIFKGSYPAMYADGVSARDWYRNYINTYIERDVRLLKNITDLGAFQHFMKLCAGRVGNVLKLTSLSNETGMSVTTIKQWLTLLQASYIVFLLQPYYHNIGPRLTKAPKIFFYDTGLACSLLGIETPDQLFTHYNRGNLFESMIISDLYKQRENKGMNPNIYFWRDKHDYEIDCIIEHPQKLVPVEIKASQTFNRSFFEHMNKWNQLTETDPGDNIIIYGGNDSQNTKNGRLVSWKTLGELD